MGMGSESVGGDCEESGIAAWKVLSLWHQAGMTLFMTRSLEANLAYSHP